MIHDIKPLADSHNRSINYLRLSITDRCNLRCTYCMPSDGVEMLPYDDILSYEEMAEFVRVAVSVGINKVRVTGGEPLVRRGVINFIGMLSDIPGIDDLAMTTNGSLLPDLAGPLREAGLQRINISLDTLDQEKFMTLTRGGQLSDVLAGIEAAREAGLTPIKINCVVEESRDEPDAIAIARFAQQNGYEARFIPRLDIAAGHFSVVDGGQGGHCASCNRLRLSSDGHLRPCLFNDISINIRSMPYIEAIRLAVREKPHSGTASDNNQMRSIGG